MTSLSSDELGQIDRLIRTDPGEALSLIDRYEGETTTSDEKGLGHRAGACIIDIGAALQRPDIVHKGISVLFHRRRGQRLVC